MPNPADNPLVADLYDTVIAAIKELLPRNYIGGLITSNDGGDPSHDVNIAVGECRDSTDVESIRLATEITKQIDAAWAAGDDAGGLDAGAVAAGTMYAVWLIKDTDGTVDALFSTSFTAPTMPGTYNRKRLIAAVCTDGASDVIPYTQVGDYFRYTGDVVSDISDNTIVDETFETGTLSVPPSCLAHVYGNMNNATTTDTEGKLWIMTKGASDNLDSFEAWAVQKTASVFKELTAIGQVLVDSNRQIEYAATEGDGAATVNVSTLGFTMLTRREP
jgi:hypothetical protein